MHDDSQTAYLQHEVAALQRRIADLETRESQANQAAAALQQSEERFTKIFRASPVAVVISTGGEGRYVEVNQRFTDLTGYSRAEVIGRTSTELGIWAKLDDRYTVGQQLEERSFVRDRELTFHTKAGKMLTVLASFELIELDGVACVLTMCQDITERQQAAIELERLYREAQEAVRSRDDFLSAAAHELRTPVTSLRGFTQLLLRRLEGGQALEPIRTHKALTVIDDQADKLAQLVERLLSLSYLQAGRLTLTYQPTDLTRLVEEIVLKIRGLMPQHTITVHAPTRIVAAVDALRLEQAFTNLVDNAARYSPNGSHIQVELSTPTPDTVRVSVIDQGLGIPPEHHPHIFDRFYRVHARSDGGGLGIGLYMTHQIVALHGGRVAVESPSAGGTCMVISLPLERVGSSATTGGR